MFPPVANAAFSALLSLFVLLPGATSLSSVVAQSISAQSPFSECAHRTETSATLVLPNSVSILFGETEHDGPLYIAVFTPEGDCAGSVRWVSEAASLTAWGTDPSSPIGSSPRTAFAPGDLLRVRLFDPATETEYGTSDSQITVSFRSDAPHLTAHRRYMPGGIYRLATIRVQSRR